ncbi:MAG: glycosyltransferase family 2 protein [Candidatus Curtissbacteria bacterium]|nr:glycosyltransferase family 2 protein [Candidatus Curtissbacteria bacterium]
MKVSIVVLNYNGLANTLECIESLKKQDFTGNDVEIIVVDNGSEDGSKEELPKLKGIKLLFNEKNLGYTGGNNKGIRDALKGGSEAILVLNNDTVVDPLLIKTLIKATVFGDVITPKIYFEKGFEFHKNKYKKDDLGHVIWHAGAHIDWENILGVHDDVDEVDHGQFTKKKEIDFATGAAMFVKREVFEKVGLFDNKYFLYLEDMDFSVRAKKNGFKIIFEPRAILWHKNAGSTGGSGSKLQDYYITRNRLLFSTKYAKLRTKIAVLRQIVSQSKDPIKRKALMDFLTFKFGKASVKF